MDAYQTLGLQLRHVGGDARAPITALRRVVRIAQPSHELGPCSRRALDIPARAGGLVREAETRQRWDDHMEGVFSRAAVTSGIRQGADHLGEFEDRPRPAVAEQERQGVRMPGAHVEEVDAQALDLGAVLAEGVEPRLATAPVSYVVRQ